MAERRVTVFDPAGRIATDPALLDRPGVVVQIAPDAHAVTSKPSDVVLISASVAGELTAPLAGSPPRWVVGEATLGAKLASASAMAHAEGIIITPMASDVVASAIAAEVSSPDIDLARSRTLSATSLIDLAGTSLDALRSIGEAFAAHDCVVWWRDGDGLSPVGGRAAIDREYAARISSLARIAAASTGTVMTAGEHRHSVIADALRANPGEVAGMVAIVSDHARRYTMAERMDLRAIGVRLARELTWLTTHRRIVAEGEKLLAASSHDPLTGAMTRGAFEQAVTHEIAAANRRDETVTMLMMDVVGLRRINLRHGHRAGDELLAQVAARARNCVRGTDPIGRFGGDELAILLVGSSAEQAILVARKLIRRVCADPITVEGSDINVELRVVVSEVAPKERSGEAAFARCHGALRTGPIGDATVVTVDPRLAEIVVSPDHTSLGVGTVVGGTYRVLHELSRGAMGVVYRGEDLGLGRPVAIKVLRADLASDRDLVSRFRSEAGILASLHHKNLVQVYSLGEHEGDVYFVMELVEGQPVSEVLRATLEKREWFPLPAVSQIVLEIADALDAMHALGLIHRDVKPANILLDRERDRAVLVDVGVAIKAGAQGEAAGTPGFAAPESFMQAPDSVQTDVYGLAATAYCMLTGRSPFGTGPALQVVTRQLNDPLVPASQHRSTLSDGVDAVLAKALEPDPKKRWASASIFAEALTRAMQRVLEQSSGSIAIQAVSELESKLAAVAVAGTHALTMDAPPTMMPPSGRVRAAHVRVTTRLLQHRLGGASLHQLRDRHPVLADILAPTLPLLGWVELERMIALLDGAAELLPDFPVARHVGRGTMSATFARLFGADPASLPVETVLRAVPTFWGRYHDWAEMQVEIDGGTAYLKMTGAPGSPRICDMIGSELERVTELCGGHNPVAAHPNCKCRGDDACEYVLSWQEGDPNEDGLDHDTPAL